MPTALITGITGQDGSYLAEVLLQKGYRVVGIVRRSSTTPYERIGHLVDRVELVSADLLDQHSLVDAIAESSPDEIYNLAAQSFVQTSWTQPVLTGEFTALGVTRILQAMKSAAPRARFYQASSSERFGLYAVSGILFNHESPRRGLEFATRKISDAVARIKLGLAKEVRLGNL